MKARVFIVAFFLAAVLSACARSSDAQLEIQDAWVRAVSTMGAAEGDMQSQGEGDMEMEMGGVNTGAFMVIRNSGGADDRLIAAYSDIAEVAEIHLSEMVDDVMTMHPVDGVDVPAGGEAELKPGSYHIMLINVYQDLNPGDMVDLALEFEGSGTINVEAEVRAP
jgi:hypothetical protein